MFLCSGDSFKDLMIPIPHWSVNCFQPSVRMEEQYTSITTESTNTALYIQLHFVICLNFDDTSDLNPCIGSETNRFLQ